MQTAVSAAATCAESASASAYTATDRSPIARKVRMMRQAIAPRLAISTVSKRETAGVIGQGPASRVVPADRKGAAGRPAGAAAGRGSGRHGVPEHELDRGRVVRV